jgi:hypothetical protein
MLFRKSIMAGAALVAAGPQAAAQDFALEEFFTGTTYAYGRFGAINGVSREFRVVLRGIWDGRKLTLREDFTYTDGERDTKTWIFRKVGPGRYIGTREDVIGKTEVRVEGLVATFSYDVNLSPKGEPNIVRFNDTLRLTEQGTVLNTAWVSKWYLPVARVRVNFARTEREALAIKP